jgi:hypothetical protein
MRFMMLVKHADKFSGPPPKELLEAMQKLSQDTKNGGTVLSSGGLASMAASTRVRLSQGKVTATDGPFAETKEVIGGYAVLEFSSKQAAVDGATQYMELHRKYWPGWEGETEVRQIFSPEDYARDCAPSDAKPTSVSRKS